MPLKNKYLKYIPEISSEIFKEIWTKLINSGWKATCDFVPISDRFHKFKRGEHLYNDNPSGKSFYINHKNIQKYIEDSDHILTETTVQEILGYDPFAKEEFILPEKWRLKITKENSKIINNWRNDVKKISSTCPDTFIKETGLGTSNEWGIEITFDQFKKYVLKEPIEQPKKEVIPEYVEHNGIIHKVKEWSPHSYCKLENGKEPLKHLVNPSTKEASDAQNKPKSIEKWSVGSYVVFCKNVNNIKKGYVDVIQIGLGYDNCIYLEKYLTMDISRETSGCIKWFATKSEAEEFAKTLVEPVKCGNGILDAVEPKQPLKQAVHCKTQEEWDFVNNIRKSSMKEYYKDYKDKSVIRLDFKNGYSDVLWAKNDGYQILSFQEWCDLNGYKMKSNIDLTGRYLKALIDGPQSTAYKKGDIVEIFKKEFSNQYRIGKVGGVWWTYTTNNGTESQWELLPEDYKMEKEVKFEVGKWYKLHNWISKFNHLERDYKFYGENINTNSGFVDKFGWLDLNEYTPIELSIEEIQQYLPENHPDKIKSSQEFKVGDYIFVMIKGKNFGDILKVRDSFIEKKSSYSGVWISHTPRSFGGGGFRLNGNGYIYGKDVRHATPEEINNHLISIGQILAGEPLNNGIEPNKDSMFKYTTGNCYNKEFSTSMIKVESTNQFNIINKTKTIKF